MQAPAKFGAADTFRCDLSAEAALSSAGGATEEAALSSAARNMSDGATMETAHRAVEEPVWLYGCIVNFCAAFTTI